MNTSSTMPKTTGYIKIDGCNVYYEKFGNGRKVVLLLHGAFGSCDIDFSRQITCFDSSKYTVVSFDSIGNGKSRPPERDFTFHNYYDRDVQMTYQVMTKLGYKKYSIFGFSEGGVRALLIAAQYGHLVDNVIVSGTFSHIDAKMGKEFDAKTTEKILSTSDMERYITVYGKEFTRHFLTMGRKVFKFYYDNGGNVYGEKLSNITCPVLILHGKMDDVISWEHSSLLHRKIKSSKVILFDDLSHFMHIESPDLIQETIQNFWDYL